MRALSEAFQHLPEEAQPWLVRFQGGAGIVRVSHRQKETALGILRALRRIGGQAVTVHTLGTSGTVRAAIRKYLEPSAP
ncbi:MAG: Rpp14/Pop5 family protein [Thermoplasmata archaeon]